MKTDSTVTSARHLRFHWNAKITSSAQKLAAVQGLTDDFAPLLPIQWRITRQSTPAPLELRAAAVQPTAKVWIHWSLQGYCFTENQSYVEQIKITLAKNIIKSWLFNVCSSFPCAASLMPWNATQSNHNNSHWLLGPKWTTAKITSEM